MTTNSNNIIKPHHLTVKLLQLVCLLRSTLDGLQGALHSVQPVLAVRLLKHHLTEWKKDPHPPPKKGLNVQHTIKNKPYKTFVRFS